MGEGGLLTKNALLEVRSPFWGGVGGIGVGLSVRLPPSADQEMPGWSVKHHIPGKAETIWVRY